MDIDIITYSEFLEKYDNIYGVIDEYNENNPIGTAAKVYYQCGWYWQFNKIKNISQESIESLKELGGEYESM